MKAIHAQRSARTCRGWCDNVVSRHQGCSVRVADRSGFGDCEKKPRFRSARGFVSTHFDPELYLALDTGNEERVASLAQTTFWSILPTLPMFLALPMLLRHGIGFWSALVTSCGVTIVRYFLTAWVIAKFGINIWT
jgi:hypothetical protein